MSLRGDDPERDTRPRETLGRLLRGLVFQLHDWTGGKVWIILGGAVVLIVMLISMNIGMH